MNRKKPDPAKLIIEYPMLESMMDYKEVFWLNDFSREAKEGFTIGDVEDAAARLHRFAPYIEKVFPKTEPTKGIIESPLREIAAFKDSLNENLEQEIKGRLFLKCDSHLPISGSVKARGGIYEVLKFAEDIALEQELITLESDYSILASDKAKKVFSKYSVAVGSTGNLGLSIGIISRELGFNVEVHMSMDARQWKKDLLRGKGAKVIEYDSDYQVAVREGRKKAEADSMCHFVDDENSKDLFLGYAVSALRLKRQLEDVGIKVDGWHQLFVYIPCGVGGAPGGIAYGLKQVFGSNVHIFFAEPTHAPCMTISMITGLHENISVYDLGIDGITEADGLAVGRASALVCNEMEQVLEGAFTIEDEKLYKYLARLYDKEGIFVEPSACAAFEGPAHISMANAFLTKNNLASKMGSATHILWATGGDMVPIDEAKSYYVKGKGLLGEIKDGRLEE